MSVLPGSIVRPLWLLAGCIALLLGLVGVVLPLLPTTPFVIFAAFCFGKSIPAWQTWLERNKLFGPIIANWREHGAIAPKFKVMALVSMVAVLTLSIVSGVTASVIVIQAVCLIAAASFILTRPNGQ